MDNINVTTCQRRFLIVQALMIFVVLALLKPSLAEAKIYKWIDAKGVTQYSQYPPTDDGVVVQEINTLSHSAERAAQAKEVLQKRVDALDERRADKKVLKEEGEEALARRKEVQAYCEASKKRLADFQSGRRLAEKQEDGSYVPVTEEQRQETISQLEADIKEQCS